MQNVNPPYVWRIKLRKLFAEGGLHDFDFLFLIFDFS